MIRLLQLRLFFTMTQSQFNITRPLKSPVALFLLGGIILSIYISLTVSPTWYVQKVVYQVFANEQGQLTYIHRDKPIALPTPTPIEQSPLSEHHFKPDEHPSIKSQWVVEKVELNGLIVDQYARLEAKFHLGLWSLLPAIIAIVLSLLTKEPLTGLLAGIVCGAIVLGIYDITDKIFLPRIAHLNTATVILLYLWLLGGLLGILSQTGSSKAFAEYVAHHLVRGPRSAKLVGWLLGIAFFQGGTISTVLVGTTVKPLADQHKVSHEEMSYVVDSTASPIAILLPFNAWPIYVQAFIFVPGAAFLATEADRIAFFFKSIPFSFYALLAVCGTLLVCLDKMVIAGPWMHTAQHRARSTGKLDADDAQPMNAAELQNVEAPAGYLPNPVEFILPLTLLISIAIGTFIFLGSPKVNWAFACALFLAATIALLKGMSLRQLIDGFGNGLKGVVLASVILMFAITIGWISRETGAGQFLIEIFGSWIPYWILPIILLALTIGIAIATGTSWGTFALAFPLVMPLVFNIAEAQQLANPELFCLICFAAVLNGSVFGDQCSPISDTTILSSMSTGADLIDHVKTQIFPASLAALGAALLWTLMMLFV